MPTAPRGWTGLPSVPRTSRSATTCVPTGRMRWGVVKNSCRFGLIFARAPRVIPRRLADEESRSRTALDSEIPPSLWLHWDDGRLRSRALFRQDEVVLVRVHQRLPARVDHVFADADRAEDLAGTVGLLPAALDDDADTGGGLV